MSTAEIILRSSIADAKATLDASIPANSPFTPEQWEASNNAIREQIALEEAVLAGGESAIADWWERIPEDVRAGLINA